MALLGTHEISVKVRDARYGVRNPGRERTEDRYCFFCSDAQRKVKRFDHGGAILVWYASDKLMPAAELNDAMSQPLTVKSLFTLSSRQGGSLGRHAVYLAKDRRLFVPIYPERNWSLRDELAANFSGRRGSSD